MNVLWETKLSSSSLHFVHFSLVKGYSAPFCKYESNKYHACILELDAHFYIALQFIDFV